MKILRSKSEIQDFVYLYVRLPTFGNKPIINFTET